MKNLAVNGYSADEVTTALLDSGRLLTFTYEWLSSSNVSKGFLTNVAPGGSITNSALSSIKRQANFSLYSASDPGFLFGSDRIRPIVSVTMPDGGLASFPQGVFLVSAPAKKYSSGLVTVDCTGYDQAQVLTDDSVSVRYVVTAGTAYTDAVAALLVNIPNKNIISSDATLPIDRIWDIGTTKLQIINDLLASINYNSLWFDGFGTAQVQPYVEPDSAPITFTYTNVGDESMFTPEVTSTLDLFSVPNYIVFTVSQPGRPVLTSTFTNDDPKSPVSIINRGRKIAQIDTSADVATQAELDALVKRAALNAANVYQSVEFTTPVMPIHENRDVLWLTHDGLDLSGKFAEVSWKMDLKAGGSMTHTVRHVVNLDASLVGTPDVSN